MTEASVPPPPAYRVANIEILAQTPALQARIFTLAVGESIPWHFHSEVADWYVCLEGSLQVETRAPRSCAVIGPGSMTKVEPKTAHLVTNVGDETCRFLLLQGVGAYDFHPVG